MPSFRTTRRVPYTPRQMFDLVADVERYPEFLPLCEGLTVRSREMRGQGEVIVATMRVGYKAIHEQFTSRVTLEPHAPGVKVEYLDGPFRYLDNRWQFKTHERGCEVDFFIAYELRSPLFQMLVGAVFEQAFRKFAEAFERRARMVYGKPAQARASPA